MIRLLKSTFGSKALSARPALLAHDMISRPTFAWLGGFVLHCICYVCVLHLYYPEQSKDPAVSLWETHVPMGGHTNAYKDRNKKTFQ